MKNTLLTLSLLFFSINSFAAENALVKELSDYANAGTKFKLTKSSGNCDKVLDLKQSLVPQSQSQINFTFGNVSLRADSSQEDTLMTENVNGVELSYRQSSTAEILSLSHYLQNVRNQLVKYYSVEKAITIEAIEYNYGSKAVYQYCVYYK